MPMKFILRQGFGVIVEGQERNYPDFE